MQKELIDNNPISKLSFDFSLAIIDFCEVLDEKKKFVISKQLLKPATSIGANAMEAQNAESKADFFTSLKLQQRKRVKHSIGYCYAIIQKIILNVKNC